MSLNLAVIEDDPALREELVEFFSKFEEINCVLVVDSIPKFRHFFRDFLEINIVLLDIHLLDESGIDGLPVIRRLLPNAEIIIHTVVNDYDTIFKCICNGANGYLLKEGNLDKLRSTLLDVYHNGGSALTPSVARRILSYFQPEQKRKTDEELSEAELKVSRLLIDGLTYQEVADALNISINGVRYHIKSIYRKLHIRSKGALLKRLQDTGFEF